MLHNFGCYADGKNPHGGVVFDRHGNLDGTTVSGGSGGSCSSDGCGIVFQLTPDTENVLYNFTGSGDSSDRAAASFSIRQATSTG